jgi:hypothetical protein
MEIVISVSESEDQINHISIVFFLAAMFCDEKCMKSAQQRYHHIECSKMGKPEFDELEIITDNDSDPTAYHRLMAESIAIAESVKKLETLMEPKKEMNVNDFDLSQPNDLKRLEIISLLNVRLPDSHVYGKKMFADISRCEPFFGKFIKSEVDRDIFATFALRMGFCRKQNGLDFSIHDRQFGGGILSFGSLFNHSCDPNVGFLFIDNKFVFVALKPIKTDEQLFIMYSLSMFTSPSRVARQMQLLKTFNFKCTCIACVKDYDMEKLPRADMKECSKFLLAAPPKEFKEAVQQFKTNCKYMKKNFHQYPTSGLVGLHFKNLRLLQSMNDLTFWPY